MSEKYIVGVDIGTSKVAAVVGRLIGRGSEIVGHSIAPCSGLKKGVVVDIDKAAEAVRTAVDEAARNSSVEIKAAYVGIAGAHIQCMQSYGAVGIKGRSVVERDLDRAIDAAATLYVPLEREVLHVMPTEYMIDGQGGILKPVGMTGVRLEADVRVISASLVAMENLTKCCENAGIKVVDMVFEALASSKSVMRPHELETAAAVIDVGCGTTDVAVFRSGSLYHAFVVPVGGHHFTNDLAIGLRISHREAERIKRLYGYVTGRPEGAEEIEVTGVDGDVFKLDRGVLAEILLPRADELFDMVAHQMGESLRFTSASSAILTGGSARLSGVDRVAESKLGVSVRTGLPQNAVCLDGSDILSDPSYSTAVGLMLYGAGKEQGAYAEIVEPFKYGLEKLKKAFLAPLGLRGGKAEDSL